MGTRHRIAFLGLVVLLAPTALAQSLPGVPTITTPSIPTVALPGPDTLLQIDEGPFRYEGTPTSPSIIQVDDPDGEPAFTYTRQADGSARVQVIDQLLLEDATLVRIDGAPTDDVFTLVLRDPLGKEQAIRIDRAALLADAPEDVPIEVLRSVAWPGAPAAPYLLYVQDARPNHLGAAALDGKAFLQLRGMHVALLQMPMDQPPYDHIALEIQRVRSAGADVANGASLRVPFFEVPTTTDAAVFRATYEPSTLSGVLSGDVLELRVVYERRLTPLVVERFPEAVAYRYAVDADGPTVSIKAPPASNDFRFAVAWDGTDALTGVRGFSVDVRAAGDPTWTRWIDGGADKSALFSGDWGKTYEFRVHSLDGVGNPSGAPAMASVAVAALPAGTTDVNDPPLARFVAPKAGASLSGEAIVEWVATDPDATPVTSKLEVSADDGATWRTLYVGTGTSFGWLTSSELDGAAYRLRLTVSDGTAQASDALSGLSVRNVKLLGGAQPAAPSTGGSATPPPSANGETVTPATDAGAAADGEGKAVPAPGLLLGALALVGAALLARPRR